MNPLNNQAAAVGLNNNDEVQNDFISSQYKVLTLAFNQDSTSLAMGTVRSYNIYTIVGQQELSSGQDFDIQPFTNIPYLRELNKILFYAPYEEVHIIERLFSSSLLAIVSAKAPRILKVCHFKKGTEICWYQYASAILAVKLNRKRLIVCLEESIYIHSMQNMKLLHTIQDIPPNQHGICALSPAEDSPYLAYPGSSVTGEIQIFDTNTLRPGVAMGAHQGPIIAMAFNIMGTLIATASTRGTVIRVHNVTTGARLFEFRRGVLRYAAIDSLTFSPDSMFLAASSNTETIHIFRLLNETPQPAAAQGVFYGLFRGLANSVAYVMPTHATEVLTQDRAFATVHSLTGGIRSTIAMNVFQNTLRLYVASYDGTFCIYEVNTNDGGECRKISQSLLFNLSEALPNQRALLRNDQQASSGTSSGQTNPSSLSSQENESHRRSLSLSSSQSSSTDQTVTAPNNEPDSIELQLLSKPDDE